jgi:hypothetical protein
MANAKSSDAGIEYTIFTQKPGEGLQPQGMTNEMEKALATADKLLETGEYEKIEVKQKYFDKKANRQVEGTLKTLTYKKPSGILPIIGLLVLAVAAGGGSFAAAYFLTRQPPAAEGTVEAGADAAADSHAAPAEKAAH